ELVLVPEIVGDRVPGRNDGSFRRFFRALTRVFWEDGDPIPGQPQSTAPPLTFRISPQMNVARSDARNTTAPAISSGSATRPRGIVARICLRRSGSSSAPRDMSVATQPGATQLTRIPDEANSGASDFVSEMIAPLAAA